MKCYQVEMIHSFAVYWLNCFPGMQTLYSLFSLLSSSVDFPLLSVNSHIHAQIQCTDGIVLLSDAHEGFFKETVYHTASNVC